MTDNTPQTTQFAHWGSRNVPMASRMVSLGMREIYRRSEAFIAYHDLLHSVIATIVKEYRPEVFDKIQASPYWAKFIEEYSKPVRKAMPYNLVARELWGELQRQLFTLGYEEPMSESYSIMVEYDSTRERYVIATWDHVTDQAYSKHYLREDYEAVWLVIKHLSNAFHL